jgi:hypothetical protein
MSSALAPSPGREEAATRYQGLVSAPVHGPAMRFDAPRRLCCSMAIEARVLSLDLPRRAREVGLRCNRVCLLSGQAHG